MTQPTDQPATIAKRILLWADKLRDHSASGLTYAETIYDRDRYRAIQDTAMEMAALATGQPLATLEPLREPIFSRPNPLIGGEGAVIDAKGRILLIQRADSRLWAMPGGALEVGETPAEGVTREVLEETGVQAEPLALAGVFDSRFSGVTGSHHLYLFVVLCRPIECAEPHEPSHAEESLDRGWFAEHALPGDLHGGTGARIAEAYRVWRDGGPAYLDL